MCADGNCPECVAARENDELLRTLYPDAEVDEERKLPETLTEWHDAFRRRNRLVRRRIIRSTYVKPPTGELKGKAAIKAAKRERVKALKLAKAKEI